MAEQAVKDQTNARHHVTPRFYLSGFSQQSRVAVWQRADGSVRSSNPTQVSTIRGFYTFTDKNGNQTDELEKYYSQVEGAAKSAISNLEGLFPPPLESHTKEVLAVFIAAQQTRSVGFHRQSEMTADMTAKMGMLPHLADRQRARKMMEGAGIEVTEDRLDQLQAIAVNPDSLELNADKSLRLQLSLNMLPELAHIYNQRTWRLVRFDHDALITSDEPIILRRNPKMPQFYGVGAATAKQVWFPLTSRMLVIMEHKNVYTSEGVTSGTDAMAHKANIAQLQASYLEAYGPPAIMRQFEGVPLGERPLMHISGHTEFLDVYNRPPTRPRPAR
jgi:hypothetical protein